MNLLDTGDMFHGTTFIPQLYLLSIPEISSNELVSLAKLCPCKMLDHQSLAPRTSLVPGVRSFWKWSVRIWASKHETPVVWGVFLWKETIWTQGKPLRDNVMWRQTSDCPESQNTGDGKKTMGVMKRHGTVSLPFFILPGSTWWADLLRPRYGLPFPKTTRRYISIVEITEFAALHYDLKKSAHIGWPIFCTQLCPSDSWFYGWACTWYAGVGSMCYKRWHFLWFGFWKQMH